MSSHCNWSVGHNMPGYLPEGDVIHTRTWREAKLILREDLERAMDDTYQWVKQAAWSAGRRSARESLSAYVLAKARLAAARKADGGFDARAGGYVWWIDPIDFECDCQD